MSELTAEERALLESDTPTPEPRRRRPREVADKAPAAVVAPVRGPHTPPQFDDDGWANLPVQMRG